MNVRWNVPYGRPSVLDDPDAPFLPVKGDSTIIVPFAFPMLKDQLKRQEGLCVHCVFHTLTHGKKHGEDLVRSGRGHKPERRLAFDWCGCVVLHRGRSYGDARPCNHITQGFARLEEKPVEGGFAGRRWATGGEKPMTTLNKKRIGRGCALEAGTGMNSVIM